MKSQITLFILLGTFLIIITTIVIVIITSNNIEKRKIQYESNYDFIITNINMCAHYSFDNTFSKLLANGGHINIPPILNKNDKALWMFQLINTQPMFKYFEENAKNLSSVYFQDCVENTIDNQRYTYDMSQLNVLISFNNNDTIIEYIINQEFKSDNNIFYIDKISIRRNVPIKTIYESATLILNEYYTNNVSVQNLFIPFNYKENIDKNLKQASYEILYEEEVLFNLSFGLNYNLPNIPKKYQIIQHNKSLMYNTFIRSIDQFAILNLSKGTKILKHNNSVNTIQVLTEQKDRIYHNNHNIFWNTRFPSYTFTPHDMDFNKPQRLRIYYDVELYNSGQIALIYENIHGVKRPIQSIHNINDHYVETFITGTSTYTPVACEEQPPKEVQVIDSIRPNTFGCWTTNIGVVITAVVVGAGGGALALIIIAGLVIGDDVMAKNNNLWRQWDGYEKSETSQTFTATCDQSLSVEKYEYNGNGKCHLTSKHVESGESVTVTAQTKRCDRLDRWLCKRCHTECILEYI
ncbi:MAG: hypothetical protein ACMXYC_00400 [Candidatus Woesearchaeota archaeon]